MQRCGLTPAELSGHSPLQSEFDQAEPYPARDGWEPENEWYLEELGKILNYTRENVRLIEAKAMRNFRKNWFAMGLKHPFRP